MRHGQTGSSTEQTTLHPNERRCADCGRIVTQYRGKWADREGRPGRRYQWGWDFCCRITIGEMGRLTRADYHYVEGEEQRHFTPTRGDDDEKG